MNIDNVEEAVFKKDTIKRLSDTLEDIDEQLAKDKLEYSWENQYNCFLYNLHILEHSDGSGFKTSFSGCGVSRKILSAIQAILVDRIAELEKEIEEL